MLSPPPSPTICYEDERLVAINKPAGMLVHRSALDAHETRFALQWLRDTVGYRVYPLHRLDKATSGVLVFAKTAAEASYWSSLWSGPRVSKTYQALVRGWIDAEGFIDYPLRDPDSPSNSPRKESQTTFKMIHKYLKNIKIDRYDSSRLALVQLQPLSGRRHQLRQHMKHISHPILGDVNYGNGTYNRWLKAQFGESRLMLHAQQIVLDREDQKICIEAPVDAYWAQVIHWLSQPQNQPEQ